MRMRISITRAAATPLELRECATLHFMQFALDDLLMVHEVLALCQNI
jgi:hypothetical protein